MDQNALSKNAYRSKEEGLKDQTEWDSKKKSQFDFTYSTPTMHPFVHLPAFKVVACVECQYAVLPGSIDTHLREKKTHNMPKGDRVRIVQEVQNIQGLILERYELNRLVVPPPSNLAIPVLQEPKKDGIKCQFPDSQGSPCKYVSRHLQQI